MLDRLISGAGAVTDGADRSVRPLAGGSQRGFATTRPGSLLVAALLLLLAGMLVVAGLEATDPSTPVTLGPADVAASTRAREPDLLHDPRVAVVDVRRVLQRRQRERHRGRGRGDPRLVLLARRPRRSGRRHRALDEASGGALHVSRDRDPDRANRAIAARSTRTTATKRVVPGSRSSRRSSSTRRRVAGSADADLDLAAPLPRDRHSRRADRRTARRLRRGLHATIRTTTRCATPTSRTCSRCSSSTAAPGTPSGCWFATTRSSPRRPR